MGFVQDAPRLSNTWRSDRALQEHLGRVLPDDVLAEVSPQLDALGAEAAGGLADLAAQAEAEAPTLVSFDAWGHRVDRIAASPAWAALHAHQVRLGLCAIPYERRFGACARVVQHALIHLYGPSSATYTCPVAMTDAAVRVLTDHAEPGLRERVVPRLVSRDVTTAWTSGQWMTERPGGSDVGRTETVARCGDDGRWRLRGIKWFTSATTADCALALARPSPGPARPGAAGSAGLGLFLVELVDPATGAAQVGRTILVNRLKDKLGTRSLPTAELTLDGAVATPIALESGLRAISGMLNVTRVHNAISAAGGMRRAVDLAADYARRREAFGARLIDLPLHRQTLADLAVEAEAAFALTLEVTRLLGRAEAGEADDAERACLRLLTPIAKLQTGKDAVAVASEALECIGGAGYIEDTGLPALLRNAQVLPIWEGTTNVLALDVLRVASRQPDALPALLAHITARLTDADVPALAGAARQVAQARDALRAAAGAWAAAGEDEVQAGMRMFAMRLGRACAAALLIGHAANRLAKHGDHRAAAVARRYAGRWLAPPSLGSPGDLAESLALVTPDGV